MNLCITNPGSTSTCSMCGSKHPIAVLLPRWHLPTAVYNLWRRSMTSILLSHCATPKVTYIPQPLRSSQLLPPKANKSVNKIRLGKDELLALTMSSPSAAIWCKVFSMHLSPQVWAGNPAKLMGAGCAPQIKVQAWVRVMGWVWEHHPPLISGAVEGVSCSSSSKPRWHVPDPLHPSFPQGWFWWMVFMSPSASQTLQHPVFHRCLSTSPVNHMSAETRSWRHHNP